MAGILYTSGSTGKPKGVMIPKRQLYWNGYNTVVNWGLREDDVSPIFTPLYHAGGLAAFLIPIFCVGGTIVLHKSFDPAAVWDAATSGGSLLREHRAVWYVPIGLALALFMLASVSIAQAQASRTWVSGVGDDANPCSRTAPCKTWAGAISKTAACGEIDALDPGGFGAVTITKSITLDGAGAADFLRTVKAFLEEPGLAL
mgnify:CR=1 FL=1